METLTAWRPAELEGAADAIEAVRRGVDDTAMDWRRVRQSLGDAWTGEAAGAAGAALASRAQRAETMVETLGMVRRTLLAATDAFTAARNTLVSAVSMAAQHDLRVRDDGTVRYAGYLTDDEELARVAIRSEIEALVEQALQAAIEADTDAAHALRKVQDATADGSGWDSADTAMVSAITERAVPAAGTDAREVAAWWVTLSATTQALLIARHPDEVGALDGLPTAVRSQANKVVLDRELTAARALVADLEHQYEAEVAAGVHGGAASTGLALRRAYDVAKERLAMLEAVQEQLDVDPDRSLLLLDTEMPGRAAIGIGDVDTAEHVAVLVPGFSSAVTNYMGLITPNAQRLADTANEGLARLGSAETVATVAWIGYHAPLGADVMLSDDALRGADQLQQTLYGIDASRTATGSTVHLTTIGHSYGSVVASEAAAQGTPEDDLVLMGSPGVAPYDARAFDVGVDHTFVGATSDDPVSYLQWFGGDPTRGSFDATRFQTDGGFQPFAADGTLPSSGHSEYYAAGTESLWNIASVVAGQPGSLTDTGGRNL